MILVVFRGAVLPLSPARGFAFFALLVCELRAFDFVFAVFEFAFFAFDEIFALDEIFRERLTAALFTFLREALFLRLLLLLFLIFFLVAMRLSLAL